MTFKEYFYESTESIYASNYPELNLDTPVLEYYDTDARAFIVAGDMYLLSLDQNVYHGHLLEAFKRLTEEQKEQLANKGKIYTKIMDFTHVDREIEIIGDFNEELYEEFNSNRMWANRHNLLKNRPNYIQGRLWKDHNVCSFWNSKLKADALPKIKKVLIYYGMVPEETRFEWQQERIISWDGLSENLGVSPSSTQSKKISSLMKKMHLLPPNLKNKVMKMKEA